MYRPHRVIERAGLIGTGNRGQCQTEHAGQHSRPPGFHRPFHGVSPDPRAIARRHGNGWLL
jgi:hypothetical protein